MSLVQLGDRHRQFANRFRRMGFRESRNGDTWRELRRLILHIRNYRWIIHRFCPEPLEYEQIHLLLFQTRTEISVFMKVLLRR